MSLTVPHQHGAWSILVAAWIAGALVAGMPNLASVCVLLWFSLGFLAQHGAGRALKLRPGDERRPAVLRWSAVWGAGAVVSWLGAAALVGPHALFWMAVCMALIGGVALAMAKLRRDRGMPAEFLGMGGLGLAAPVTAHAIDDGLRADIVGLSVLMVAFAVCSVPHVHFLVRKHKSRKEGLADRLRAGSLSLATHGVALIAAVGLVPLGLAPPLAPLALVPSVGRGVVAVLRRREAPPKLVHIGLWEVLWTVCFLVLVGVAWRI